MGGDNLILIYYNCFIKIHKSGTEVIMFRYVVEGFMLGIAYVAPIGMQNLFVINNALSGNRGRAYIVALCTSLFDILLALACFFGVGLIFSAGGIAKSILLIGGSGIIIYIGIQLIFSTPKLDSEVDVNKSIGKLIFGCFFVTWANPQALIDVTLLFGGVKASLPIEGSYFFLLGVMGASLTWFVLITTVISVFKKALNVKVLKVLNVLCGAVLIGYGFSMIYRFIISL